LLIVFQPEHIVETATRLGRVRRRRWRISAMQAGTTPKKRTSLNGRAALKLMRLDGAECSPRASDARVTKAILHCSWAAADQFGRKRHRMPVVARPRWQVVVVSNRGL